MMQEEQQLGPGTNDGPRAFMTSQSLAALLALAGSKSVDAETLRTRMNLSHGGFGALLSWLQREYLVDVVSTIQGDEVQESVELTERGERVLVGVLEQTCELPELN
jgi:hypothetical protein